MHNALGQALKEFIVIINKNQENNINNLILLNPESKNHSDASSTNSQNENKK